MRVKLWLIIFAAWLAGAPLASAQVIGNPTLISAQSSSVCATTNAFAAFPIGNSASVSFGITGTWSGTLTFKSSADGSTWVTTQVTNLGSGTTPVTIATSNGQFGLSNTGLLNVCVDATAWSSGTATVTLTRGWSARGGGATNGGGGSVTGGTCTNQVTTAISTTGVPTCTTVTSAYKDTSIASTGVDINTSYQVTATHLASPLPVAQGGLAASLSATGGTSQVLQQTTTGAAITVGQLASTSLSDVTGWTDFTPAISIGGSTTGITYGSRVGRYTQIGKLVIYQLTVNLTSLGGLSGAILITGLPATSKNTANEQVASAMVVQNMAATITGTEAGIIQPNTTAIQPFRMVTGTLTQLIASDCTNTSGFFLAGTYEAN